MKKIKLHYIGRSFSCCFKDESEQQRICIILDYKQDRLNHMLQQLDELESHRNRLIKIGKRTLQKQIKAEQNEMLELLSEYEK